MCGVNVRGNSPGSHTGVFREPGSAGEPPFPIGKIDCQQPSDGDAPDDGQLWSGEACGADALTCPLQPTPRRRPARQRRLAPDAPACCHVTYGTAAERLSAAVRKFRRSGGPQGAVGWKERISSVPGRTTPAWDSGTSFQAPGRSPSGSETTNRVSSPTLCRISTSGCS